MLTFCVKVLREFFSFLHIFLKAYTLGCWCVVSVTTRWLQYSWHSADAADPTSRSRTWKIVWCLRQRFMWSFCLLLVIPPAYEVCRGVYSFCLSFCSSVRVNILLQSFFLMHIYLKAYTLGCWCVVSITTRWLQNSWHHSADAAGPRSKSQT